MLDAPADLRGGDLRAVLGVQSRVPLAEQAAPPRPVPSREVPASIGVLALIPREPLGLPIVAWIGGAIYLFMLVLILGSML